MTASDIVATIDTHLMAANVPKVDYKIDYSSVVIIKTPQDMEERTNCYKKYEKWKNLKIKTADGLLYYCTYKLAEASDYFKKLFESEMADSNSGVIDLTDYDTNFVINVLTFVDSCTDMYIPIDGATVPILKFLNYYQFGKIISLFTNMYTSKEYPLEFIGEIDTPEFLEGVYGEKFKAFVDKYMSLYTNLNTKTRVTEMIDYIHQLGDNPLSNIRKKGLHILLSKLDNFLLK
jgi:hypothetical protein